MSDAPEAGPPAAAPAAPSTPAGAAPPPSKYPVNYTLTAMHEDPKTKIKDAYEAKIIAIKQHQGVWKYIIHFKGWNTRHDIKVPLGEEKDILHDMTLDEYRRRNGIQVEGDDDDEEEGEAPAAPTSSKAAEKKKGKGTPKVAKTPKTPAAKTPAAKNTRNAAANTTPARLLQRVPDPNPLIARAADQKLEVNIPKPLRKILIDDHDLVTRGFVNKVPATYPCDKIIQDYIKTIPVTAGQLGRDDLHIEYEDLELRSNNLVLVLTARGLLDYFNVVLGYQLLYKFERPQYNDLVRKYAAERGVRSVAGLPEHGFRSSEEYGIVHLLRMISKLPELLELSNWNGHLKNRIVSGVTDFLVFLNKNYETYYKEGEDYVSATIDYYRRAAVELEHGEPSTSAQSN